MKTFALTLALAVASFAHAGPILLDNFDGSDLNTSLWTPSGRASDSSVVVSDGSVALSNRGRILSNTGFAGPIDVRFSFQFTGSLYDSFKVGLRTDGVVTNSPGEFDNGVFASFRMRSDPGDTSGNISLYSQQNPNGISLGIGTYGMTLNQTYKIRLLDTGSTVSLFINDFGAPILSANTLASYGNQVGFYNREGAGAGSGISAGSQVKIDYVSVSSVPDAGTTAGMLGVALTGLCVARRRRG